MFTICWWRLDHNYDLCWQQLPEILKVTMTLHKIALVLYKVIMFTYGVCLFKETTFNLQKYLIREYFILWDKHKGWHPWIFPVVVGYGENHTLRPSGKFVQGLACLLGSPSTTTLAAFCSPKLNIGQILCSVMLPTLYISNFSKTAMQNWWDFTGMIFARPSTKIIKNNYDWLNR